MPVNFLFPPLFQHPVRFICLTRSKHVVAHVGPFLVVERNDPPQLFFRFLHVSELLHPVEPFALQDAVHAFRHGIVRGLVVLRHADGYMMAFQTFHIGVATVLYAPVGVMDQPLQVVFPGAGYRHLQCLYRIYGMKAGGQSPAYYLAGIGIRHQVQIAGVVLHVYIGYVAYPKFVRRSHGESFRQVRVFVETVVAVGRAVALHGLEHKAVASQQRKERIPTGHHLTPVNLAEHEIEFEAADAGSFNAYLTDRRHKGLFKDLALQRTVLVLIVGLPTVTKQATKDTDALQ